MSILLLAAILVTIGTGLAATIHFNDGDVPRVRRLALRWAIGAAIYVIALIAVPLFSQVDRNTGGTGTGSGRHCDDDWCLSVEGVSRTPGPSGVSYRLDLRLFSLANHGPRSARGAWVYLADDRGRRFPPVADPSAIPLGVALEPHQSVNTWLTFEVPADARQLRFIGGLPGIGYASFIIGNGDLVHRPRMSFRVP